MNKKQRVVVLIGVALVAAMMLFPPWTYRWKSAVPLPGGTPTETRTAGYALLFAPPRSDAYVDTSRLVIQMGIVAVLAFGLYVSLGHKKG